MHRNTHEMGKGWCVLSGDDIYVLFSNPRGSWLERQQILFVEEACTPRLMMHNSSFWQESGRWGTHIESPYDLKADIEAHAKNLCFLPLFSYGSLQEQH
jgi:hypothetical protein